jgi:hypothetical protein
MHASKEFAFTDEHQSRYNSGGRTRNAVNVGTDSSIHNTHMFWNSSLHRTHIPQPGRSQTSKQACVFLETKQALSAALDRSGHLS